MTAWLWMLRSNDYTDISLIVEFARRGDNKRGEEQYVCDRWCAYADEQAHRGLFNLRSAAVEEYFL